MPASVAVFAESFFNGVFGFVRVPAKVSQIIIMTTGLQPIDWRGRGLTVERRRFIESSQLLGAQGHGAAGAASVAGAASA